MFKRFLFSTTLPPIILTSYIYYKLNVPKENKLNVVFDLGATFIDSENINVTKKIHV